MKKKVLAVLLAGAMVFSLAGCGSSSSTSEKKETKTTEASNADQLEATEVTLFAAASLKDVMAELITKYNETQPNVKITGSYDSSGTLLTQIEEGAACDVFFSAAQKQMDTLQDTDKLVVDGTRHNVVNNQLCVITQKDSTTKVTGLSNLQDAASLAIAGGSVPAGKYTRAALIKEGVLAQADDPAAVTTQEISDALGGVTINEGANVTAVRTAITEGANEVGTVYKSDTYGFEKDVKILEVVSYDLTGNIIYPVAQVTNKEADELEQKAAADFIQFLKSDDAKTIFETYLFDTNVED